MTTRGWHATSSSEEIRSVERIDRKCMGKPEGEEGDATHRSPVSPVTFRPIEFSFALGFRYFGAAAGGAPTAGAAFFFFAQTSSNSVLPLNVASSGSSHGSVFGLPSA